MWPWVQILSQVLPDLPEAERNHLLDTELGRMVTFGVTVLPPPTVPDPDARFRLFGQAADLLGEVAARFPLLIVVDDIQWADAASLELLVHIASRRPRAAVFVGALRTDTALRRTSLEQALATLSRLSTHRRVSLGPLARAEVGELIRQETGSWPTADLVGAIETRTEGTRSSFGNCRGCCATRPPRRRHRRRRVRRGAVRGARCGARASAPASTRRRPGFSNSPR